jgi:hypothetical protein
MITKAAALVKPDKTGPDKNCRRVQSKAHSIDSKTHHFVYLDQAPQPDHAHKHQDSLGSTQERRFDQRTVSSSTLRLTHPHNQRSQRSHGQRVAQVTPCSQSGDQSRHED